MEEIHNFEKMSVIATDGLSGNASLQAGGLARGLKVLIIPPSMKNSTHCIKLSQEFAFSLAIVHLSEV